MVAIPTIKSASSIVEELMIVCVPSTNKSPLILTLPVLSPTVAGSMIISSGPTIVADVDAPLVIAIPVVVVSNFLELS